MTVCLYYMDIKSINKVLNKMNKKKVEEEFFNFWFIVNGSEKKRVSFTRNKFSCV